MAGLLPSNATVLERALAEVLAGQFTALVGQVDLRALRDPARCPAARLPWLAWERGIPVWGDAWDEPARRAVVGGAYGLARSAGTLGGLRDWFRRIGLGVAVVESQQHHRGHIQVGDGTPLSDVLLVARAVTRASVHWTATVPATRTTSYATSAVTTYLDPARATSRATSRTTIYGTSRQTAATRTTLYPTARRSDRVTTYTTTVPTGWPDTTRAPYGTYHLVTLSHTTRVLVGSHATSHQTNYQGTTSFETSRQTAYASTWTTGSGQTTSRTTTRQTSRQTLANTSIQTR